MALSPSDDDRRKRPRRRHASPDDSDSRRRKKKRKSEKEKKRKKKRYRSDSSSSSSSDDSSYRRQRKASKERRRKRDKKERKKRKESGARRESSATKLREEHSKLAPESAIAQPAKLASAATPPIETTQKRAMVPMSREQYEAQRKQVREVFDEESGRYRLMRGDGEIIERIVSRGAHEQINQNATRGDGSSFAKNIVAAIRR